MHSLSALFFYLLNERSQANATKEKKGITAEGSAEAVSSQANTQYRTRSFFEVRLSQNIHAQDSERGGILRWYPVQLLQR